MEVFLVGGAVRDELLGLEVDERDWVVVGATIEEMLQQGFKQVGKDFPVFLHPRTGQEYALARTERKKGKGYYGFEVHASPEITLEEDLLRRDLTINAIAKNNKGDIIDPYGGQQDLKNRVLRHVSQAFSEDPLRVLRVARFAAALSGFGFTIATETIEQMKQIVATGELLEIAQERIWQETRKALQTKTPSKFFETLNVIDALSTVLPDLEPIVQNSKQVNDSYLVLDKSCEEVADVCARLAIFILALTYHDLEDRQHLFKNLPVPTECKELVALSSRYNKDVLNANSLDADGLLKLICGLDIRRKPERAHKVFRILQLVHNYFSKQNSQNQVEYIYSANEELQKIEPEKLKKPSASRKEIGDVIRSEQVKILQKYISSRSTRTQ